jgi:NAD(P)H-nitrite reductase large subunit
VNAIWPEAVEQGRIAGMNMAGRSVAYRGSLSRNVIRIFGLDVMTGGMVNPPPGDSQYEILCFDSPRLKIYRKLVFRGDTLVGMVMVNGIKQGGVFISLMQRRTPVTIPKAAMLDPSFNCASAMGAQASQPLRKLE